VSDGRVEIAAFQNGLEVEGAAALLRASGIEVEIAPFDPGGVRAFLHQPAPGRLLVQPADAAKAREILDLAQSGAYEKEVEELSQAESAPEEPASRADIDAGLRSIARARRFVIVATFLAIGFVVVAFVSGRNPAVLMIAVFGGWLLLIAAKMRLHFAKCPRCGMRFHGNRTWVKGGLPDACASCDLKLP